MIEDSAFESFAHYASGMAAMSFGMWAVILYRWRKRNRMTFLLFVVIAYIALCFLKDVIFLLPSQNFSDFYFVENLVSIIDVSYVPLVCAFFLEATKPGIVTNRRLLVSFLAFIVFIPLYCVFHAQWAVVGSFALSLLATAVTLVLVPINVVRYNKYLSDNYSFVKDIGVGWCVACTFGFFLWLVFYQLCFYEPTWFGEMIYDAGFVVVWNIICLLNINHHVVGGMLAPANGADEEKEEAAPTEEPRRVDETKTQTVMLPSADIQQDVKENLVADSLMRCMEEDKLYLNPRLSLAELAYAAGTNKTYISTYINAQGKTFYDYVNEYRVAEACRVIDAKTASGERFSMADVASASGFNSISTFNRYFSKLKGITPTNYSKK